MKFLIKEGNERRKCPDILEGDDDVSRQRSGNGYMRIT